MSISIRISCSVEQGSYRNGRASSFSILISISSLQEILIESCSAAIKDFKIGLNLDFNYSRQRHRRTCCSRLPYIYVYCSLFCNCRGVGCLYQLVKRCLRMLYGDPFTGILVNQ
jgi:hypothetical protein